MKKQKLFWVKGGTCWNFWLPPKILIFEVLRETKKRYQLYSNNKYYVMKKSAHTGEIFADLKSALNYVLQLKYSYVSYLKGELSRMERELLKFPTMEGERSKHGSNTRSPDDAA